MAIRRSTDTPLVAKPRRKRTPVEVPYTPQTEFGKFFVRLADEAREAGLKQLSPTEIQRELNRIRYGR